ncbi:S-adenosyl-L-methionine-dependent methyltransferase [Cercophora scortea]|uniref:S-adenosyl-L-methionine-dependent methyltransferase n=1 Tax=Cercophora scortea TaxID=314031 RepID=A0AAE0IB89_9PEZI|nr:S-adenosyl-L-methionine-dependent methyltransferase [Cercophora scortea]
MSDTAQKSPSPRSSPRAAAGGAPPTVLEADPDAYEDDGDSAFGPSDQGSETTSLASSIYRFREENGRTYNAYKEGAYFLPNDESENSRLDLQHNLCILMQDNRLFISPAGKDKPLGRVLDAGCGTGIWAIDFADEHPESSVVGVDLSPIQPPFVPPNLQFLIDDLESEWTYTTPFDFIYMRLLCGSIKDWPNLFRQSFQNLNPGGYIEVCDPLNPLICDDGTLPADCALVKWNHLFVEASIKLGASLISVRDYEKQLVEAGFINVEKVEFKWPINSWPKDKKYKELGSWVYENILEGLQALSLMLFTNVLGWTPEELEVFLVDVRKDLKNRSIHAYWPFYIVYGQKPE